MRMSRLSPVSVGKLHSHLQFSLAEFTYEVSSGVEIGIAVDSARHRLQTEREKRKRKKKRL